MLTTIINAQAMNKEFVVLPFSKIKFDIANILKNCGYLSGIEKRKRKIKKSEHDFLHIDLKYGDYGPAISGVKLISRPSRRMYVKADQIKPVRSGFGISIISTPKGVMSSKDARKQKLGGEILFEVW